MVESSRIQRKWFEKIIDRPTVCLTSVAGIGSKELQMYEAGFSPEIDLSLKFSESFRDEHLVACGWICCADSGWWQVIEKRRKCADRSNCYHQQNLGSFRQQRSTVMLIAEGRFAESGSRKFNEKKIKIYIVNGRKLNTLSEWVVGSFIFEMRMKRWQTEGVGGRK